MTKFMSAIAVTFVGHHPEEKLRAAEVEVSLERAKIARERAELEERLLSLQNDQAKHQAGVAPGADTAKPARGKWLSRLGLKDNPS